MCWIIKKAREFQKNFYFCFAAAKSLQSCPTLCDPIDGLLPGSFVPGILQARTLEWVAISFSSDVWSEWSEVIQSCPTLWEPHGLLPTRLLRPWDFPVKRSGVGCHFLLYSKEDIDVFLELSCFFDDPSDVGSLFSGSSAFSKTSLNIRKFTVHVLLKPSLENFEHYFTSMWDECNYVVVGAFFGIAFLWDWNENWPFPVLWLLLSFPKFAGILSPSLHEMFLWYL